MPSSQRGFFLSLFVCLFYFLPSFKSLSSIKPIKIGIEDIQFNLIWIEEKEIEERGKKSEE